MASNKYAITNPNDWLVVAQACVGAKACTAIYSFGICDDVSLLFSMWKELFSAWKESLS